jgi:hypothetical protein
MQKPLATQRLDFRIRRRRDSVSSFGVRRTSARDRSAKPQLDLASPSSELLAAGFGCEHEDTSMITIAEISGKQFIIVVRPLVKAIA